MTDKRSVIAILGPTASGKSALAIAVAQAFDGVVINCDSMQIYDGLRLITARPSTEEEAAAPHRLYAALPPTTRCSVKRWMDMARHEIDTCWQAGKLPILTGGTGMYLNGLKDGISAIPEIPDDVRDAIEARIDQYGPDHLYNQLAMEDPATAAILKPGDRQRLARAMGLWQSTGKGLKAWWDEAPVTGKLDADWHCYIMAPDRAVLYDRCNQRLAQMFNEGAIEEVAALKALQLDPALPVMKAVGVPEIMAYLNGDCSQDEALERARMMTRRYVKRQFTWFRGQISDAIWLEGQPGDTDYFDAMQARVLDDLADLR